MNLAWVGSQAFPDGAFYAESGSRSMHPASSNGTDNLKFQASRSNSIFGQSSTVQPASAQILMIVKI